MFLRVQTITSRGHTYRYAQLVQSYRGRDGKPTNRVVANLGELGDRDIGNFRAALDATRTGRRVVVLPGPGEDADWGIRVRANLDYLDVATALAMWDYWKLSELFHRLLPRGSEAVDAAGVVAALAIQRCLAPGSKHYAQTWFPKTALPELLPMDPEHFNNTRLHRVLESLDRVDGELQEELPTRYQQRTGAFATLFMDVTDTWFEGRGCDLAQRDRTKEGFRNRYKIGIVLSCDPHGFPLRWKVVGGKVRDPQCLSEMVDTLRELPWVGDAPVVCDRGMGRAGTVAKLLNSGLRFVTATTRSEIESYTDRIPHQALAGFEPEATVLTMPGDLAEAGRRVEAAGMQRVGDLLFVLDLGVQERTLSFELPAPAKTGETWDPECLGGGAAVIARARQYRAMLDRKEAATQAVIARREGLTRARMTQIMNTLRLDDVLQEQVMAGDFGHLPEHFLRAVVRLRSGEAQRRVLAEHAQTARAATGADAGPKRMLTGKCKAALRQVVYFNPQMYVDMRQQDAHRREAIAEAVEGLNRRLRNALSPRRVESVHAEVMGRLAQDHLIDVYRVHVEPARDGARDCLQVRLEFDAEEWARRRRYDGFVLLVAHPEMPHSAEDIVRLYREKDKVEKDFCTIKSAVKLRPVYHHTDPKVRAHITICMLALLLERTLEYRLARSSQPMTATACFEELRSCHLNVLATDPDAPPSYTVTDPTQEQAAILRSLRLQALVDDKEVATRIQARSFYMSDLAG